MTGEQPIDRTLNCEQTINRFAKIHLINQYGKKSYLDSLGGSDCNGQYGIQTSTKSNRDTGSGTWEIRAAFPSNIGGSVKYGDKIQLINQYGRKSYLDTCGGYDGNYGLQTSLSPNRQSGSGTWEIKSASGTSKKPVTSSWILKAKQKLGVTFNFNKQDVIDFTKFSKMTMCRASEANSEK